MLPCPGQGKILLEIAKHWALTANPQMRVPLPEKNPPHHGVFKGVPPQTPFYKSFAKLTLSSPFNPEKAPGDQAVWPASLTGSWLPQASGSDSPDSLFPEVGPTRSASHTLALGLPHGSPRALEVSLLKADSRPADALTWLGELRGQRPGLGL